MSTKSPPPIHQNQFPQADFTYAELWRYRYTKHKKKIKLFALFCIVIFLLFCIYYISVFALAKHAERHMKYYRSCDELNAYYNQHANVEKGAVIAAALENINEDSQYTDQLSLYNDKITIPFVIDKAPSAKQKSAAESLVRINQSILDTLDTIQTNEVIRYPADYKEGLFVLLPHLGNTRRAARISEINFVLNLQNNNTDAAINDLLRVFKLANSLKYEPAMVSQLVRVSIYVKATNMLNNALTIHPFTDPQLQQLQQQIQNNTYDQKRVFTDIVLSDLTSILEQSSRINQEYLSYSSSSPTDKMELFVWKYLGFNHIDRKKIIDLYQAILHQIQQENDDFSWIKSSFTGSFNRFCIHYNSTTPAYDVDFSTIQRNAPCRASNLIAIASERYYLKYNKASDDETLLVPEFLEQLPDSITQLDVEN